jgi:N-acetylmuramoyl-L-alanine amidase
MMLSSSLLAAAVSMAAISAEGVSVSSPSDRTTSLIAQPPVEQQALSYVDRLDQRGLDAIELLVLHATETPNLASAREFAEVIHYSGSQTGNSGHFYVDRDGRVVQYVALDRVAHHVRGHNSRSIGIELVNAGRFPNWFDSQSQDWTDSYPDEQVKALLVLIKALKAKCPNLRWISRHSDLDHREIAAEDQTDVIIRRKLDPGATFPWQAVQQQSGLLPWSEPMP